MTDAEILEKLREYFQTKVNNLSGDEMAEGPFEDPDETPETYGDRWEAAAKVIDRRGGLRIRFEFADEPASAAVPEPAERPRWWGTEDGGIAAVMCGTCHTLGGHDDTCAAQQREERAVAEARPHDRAADEEDACPHCSPTHARPESRPWGVFVASERDGDGQPTHLAVMPSNGAHVAQSDADWLWQLIRDYRPTPQPGAEARPHDDEESTPAFEDRGGQVYLNGTDAW